jgi:hypothetical protein
MDEITQASFWGLLIGYFCVLTLPLWLQWGITFELHLEFGGATSVPYFAWEAKSEAKEKAKVLTAGAIRLPRLTQNQIAKSSFGAQTMAQTMTSVVSSSPTKTLNRELARCR